MTIRHHSYFLGVVCVEKAIAAMGHLMGERGDRTPSLIEKGVGFNVLDNCSTVPTLIRKDSDYQGQRAQDDPAPLQRVLLN